MAYKEMLAVNFSPERLKQVKLLGMFAKAKVRSVAEEEKDRTLGQLLGLTAEEMAAIAALAKDGAGEETPDTAQEAPEEVTKEALIFLGFNQAELSKTLDAIRRGPLKEIALKAAITPHNISWTLHKVLQELSQEHAYFANRGKK